MCSAALLCDTRWPQQQDLCPRSRNLSTDIHNHNKNAVDAENMSDSPDLEAEFQDCSETGTMLLHGEVDEGQSKTPTSPQHVARQDSGVPEDMATPSPKDSPPEDEENPEDAEDPDGTMNSDCNITVIHVTADNSETMQANVLAPDSSTVPEENHDNEASPRDFTPEGKDSKDGSDSGVEGCASELPRVEYASSFNGLDEASCDSSLVSCCSVYEDPCAILPDDSRMQSIHTGSGGGGGEGTSEGGSESSSVAGSVGGPRSARFTTSAKRSSFASSNSSNVSATPSKRKTTDSASSKSSSTQSTSDHQASRCPTTPRVKARSGSTTTPRAPSSNRTPASSAASRDRGRSREGRSATRENVHGTPVIGNGDRRGSTSGKFRTPATPLGVSSNVTVRTRTRPLPDSLPSVLTTEIDRDLAAQRGRSAASASRSRGGSCSSRGRGSTPGSTPSEESRKSLLSATPKSLYTSRTGTSSLDEKALDTYATLPRTRNKTNFSLTKSIDRADEITGKTENNTRSGSRDASLSRLSSAKKPRVPSSRDSVTLRKCLPPYPKVKTAEKTRIYHETSVQTGLTCQDIEKALAGVAIRPHDPELLERLEVETQTENTWEDVRVTQAQLKNITAEANKLKLENERLEAERSKLDKLLAEERADHAFARQELDRNARRVLAMLGTPQSEQAEGSDSFLELETHFQSSGQVVANQQSEIADLQSLCRMLNRDLEKSLAAQKALLQQHQELEAESTEMQDFLQEEKAMLAEALKDAEAEIARKDELLAQSAKDLARLTEECKHLVRISEQRRQENLSLGMKLNSVDRKGRDILLGQNAAVSGAGLALSRLGIRIDALVDQLVCSYGISEQELEDVIYHNEAYSRSNSSSESSPSKHSLEKEPVLSPKKPSFVSAVLGAIKNAATQPFGAKSTAEKKPSAVAATKEIFKGLFHKELSTDASSDLLDFETEPCLMMESVLEDVPVPDTYSHNMVSSSDSLRRGFSVPEPMDDVPARLSRHSDESSFTNLTQAILDRRKAEDEEETEECDSRSESEDCGGGTENNSAAGVTDYSPAVTLVDQVIEVDNLVTKLLKVLRRIQMENESCIRDLREDKTELESKLETHKVELMKLRKLAENFLNRNEIAADVVVHKENVEKLMEGIKKLSAEENVAGGSGNSASSSS